MEYKYDAFISYRHAEKDTLIASEIQKSLERFKIPKAIQKQTGKTRFNRIFRDVEELPISSNLTEDLTEALRLSEHLIVICSYKTSESDWVRREIDTFLELHDYNKQLILTVLVEGEPDEVIPEVLRHDNITHYLADGTFYCRDEVVEPLAANYRMPLAKARKIELPRLAASMLGCNYDDIIRRRKAFRRRRLLIETAVISAAAIVLMVYIGWMMMRIQDSLKNSQMSQSRYLASESQKLLADGDRIGAIHLAIAALEDSNGNLRPETSEARYALASALGAYLVKGTTYSTPGWRYETTSTIVKYDKNSKIDRLAILEATGKLSVWNMVDHTLINTLQDEQERFFDFCYDKDDNLIVINRDYVALYDTKTWNVLWQCKPAAGTIIRDNCSKSFSYLSEDERIVVNCKTMLMLVNAKTGEIIETLNMDDPVFDELIKDKAKSSTKFTIDNFAVTSDLSKVAVSGTVITNNNYALFLYDKKTNKWLCLNKESDKILKHGFDGSGNYVVLRRLKEDQVLNNFDSTDKLYDYNVNIELFTDKGKSLWKTNIPAVTRIIDIQAFKHKYTLSDGTETDILAASFANKCVFLNFKDGKVIKSFDLLGSVIGANWYTTGYGVITRDGKRIIIPTDASRHQFTTDQLFNEGLMKVLSYTENKSISFLVEDSTQRIITEYSSNFSDSTYKAFDGSENKSVVSEGIKCGKYLVTLVGNKEMSCYDLENHKFLWEKDDSETFYPIEGAVAENKYVFLLKKTDPQTDTDKFKLVKLNCEDGQVIDANSEFRASSTNEAIVRNGNIWTQLFDKKEKTITLYSYNMSKDTVNTAVAKISDEAADIDYIGNINVSTDEKKAFVYFTNNRSEKNSYYRMEIDCSSGVCKAVETNGLKSIWNDKGSLLAELTDDGKICVYSPTGKTLYTVDTEMRTVWGMAFENENLYVYYTNDLLTCFDKNGKQTVNTFLDHYETGNNQTIGFEFRTGHLFLTHGSFTDIINLKDGRSICSFLGYVCNYSSTGKHTNLADSIIVCKSYYKGETTPALGYFTYKTTNRLVMQAKEFLKGTTPRDELKRKYGL